MKLFIFSILLLAPCLAWAVGHRVIYGDPIENIFAKTACFIGIIVGLFGCLVRMFQWIDRKTFSN